MKLLQSLFRTIKLALLPKALVEREMKMDRIESLKSEHSFLEFLINENNNPISGQDVFIPQSYSICRSWKGHQLDRYLMVVEDLETTLYDIQNYERYDNFDLFESISYLAEIVGKKAKKASKIEISKSRYFSINSEINAISIYREFALFEAVRKAVKEQVKNSKQGSWLLYQKLSSIKSNLKRLFRSLKTQFLVRLRWVLQIDYRELLEKLICPWSKQFARGALHIYG